MKCTLVKCPSRVLAVVVMSTKAQLLDLANLLLNHGRPLGIKGFSRTISSAVTTPGQLFHNESENDDGPPPSTPHVTSHNDEGADGVADVPVAVCSMTSLIEPCPPLINVHVDQGREIKSTPAPLKRVTDYPHKRTRPFLAPVSVRKTLNEYVGWRSTPNMQSHNVKLMVHATPLESVPLRRSSSTGFSISRTVARLAVPRNIKECGGTRARSKISTTTVKRNAIPCPSLRHSCMPVPCVKVSQVPHVSVTTVARADARPAPALRNEIRTGPAETPVAEIAGGFALGIEPNVCIEGGGVLSASDTPSRSLADILQHIDHGILENCDSLRETEAILKSIRSV